MQFIAGCCSRSEEEFMASTAPPDSGLESAAHPTIEQLTALARDRRSIRGFQRNRDVPDALIRQIIEVARWAPSGGNGQPWEFVVVRDAAMRQGIADLFMKQQEEKKEMELAIRGTIRMTGAGFRDAPVHIVVVGDPRVNESYPVRTREDKGERHFITGLANATLLLHLAAASLGLASQYVSDAGSPYMATMIRARLGIPDPLRVYELIPIGWPLRQPQATPRRALDELIHQERYDLGKQRDWGTIQEFLHAQTRRGAYGKSQRQAVADQGMIFEKRPAE
jgi:5,6-dimethylbenzimidazole synthase